MAVAATGAAAVSAGASHPDSRWVSALARLTTAATMAAPTRTTTLTPMAAAAPCGAVRSSIVMATGCGDGSASATERDSTTEPGTPRKGRAFYFLSAACTDRRFF